MDGKISWNYFTYFDLKAQTILIGLEQDWFKEDVRLFNQFVRDGIAPESCLVENNEIFTDKLNNGEYAVAYAWLAPDTAKYTEAGKPWQYRKVYFDIEQDLTTNLVTGGEIAGSDGVSIFKDKVAEEDLPQILTWLDFMYTDAGMKLISWGPRTSGLWEEVNGVRRFTDKELEQCLVYNVENGANVKYNLAMSIFGSAVPEQYPHIYVGIQGGGIFAPRYVYDLSNEARNPGGANVAFATGMFDPLIKSSAVMAISADAWSFGNTVPEMKRFWDVKGAGFEPTLSKCLAARTDAEFEQYYQEMLDFAHMNGLNAESVQASIDWMKAEYPDEWAAYLKGYN